ncbi:MAG: DUF4968 domain-containing protein [Firmicutes bacterium]|nr:DUF4968 domain-containing protein [Bacillota bacterium]
MTKFKKITSRIILFILLFTLILPFLLVTTPIPASAALGDATSVNVKGDTLDISVGADKVLVQVIQDDTIKVDYQPGGASSPDTQIIDPQKTWGPVGANIGTALNPMVITTSKMKVKINKTPLRISVYDANDNLLIREQDAEGVYNDGVRFNHNTGDNFYGIGGYNAWDNSAAKILRNNGGSVYAGAQGHAGAPFVWSNKGYGVLVDSDGGSFTIDSTRLEYSGVSKTDIEYYVMVGSPADNMSSLAEISGKPPMFPKWGMGFTNTEWGINQTELTDIVNTYRQKNIPIDNFVMDFDWKAWGEDNYGEWRWNTTKFPDGPSGALKSLMDSKGIKLSGIMKPRIHVNTVQGQYATNNGFWWPGKQPYTDYFSGQQVNDLNFAIPAARTWYFDHIKDSFNTGIIGWWNDEADDGYDNWQFMNMQKALYEGQRAYVNQRVWSINRNFYLGAQRYAYGMWSGDIDTGFASMANQRDRMLSAINLGEVKWGMDTGGFNGGDPTPENYARWMQFSAFTPIFRVHGQQNLQRQPWVFGTQAETVSKDVMQLRYKLIPYVYAYERKAYESGVGLVKPLVYDYPNDPNVANYTDGWMFGDWLYVAPVVDQGQTSKSVYLPAGTWIDYFKGTVYNGGQTINYSVNSSTWTDIPLFIKKGAVIPSQDLMNYVGEFPVSTVYVDVFPDTAQTSFNYYDDDEMAYNYEDGVYFKQTMTTKDNGDHATFNVYSKTGTFTPALQNYIVKMHGRNTTGVTIDGAAATRYADYAALTSASGQGWATGSDIFGAVTYVKIAAGTAKNVVVTGGAAPPPLPPYKYEAENASLSGGASVNTNHAGYSGTGFVDGYWNAGAATTFTVNVPSAGDYDVTLRYANATGSNKTISIFVNNIKLRQTTLSNLANWDTWADKVETIPLNAGVNTISYKYDTGDTGNVNLDYILVPGGTAPKIPVTFIVHNATTNWGQNVYISGNITELGNWDTSLAAGPASNPNYPTWELTVDLPAGTPIQFKAIKKDGSSVVWEGGGNHQYTVPTSGSGSVEWTWVN